jgi:pentatricopeptide repeat domain-containing protein 1
VITHNATFSACEKGQQPTRALELLAEMQGRELKPGVFTYNATISALQGQGLDPDVITYNATISACAKGYLPERALELFAETARNQRMREGSAT